MPGVITDVGEVLRNKFPVFVDVSEDGAALPEWEVQGYKVEESSQEFEIDEDTMTDIIGITHNTVNSMTITQDFDPNTLRFGAKLSEKLLDITRRRAVNEFSMFKVMVVYGFMGSPGAYEADMYSACTIRPTGLGGSSRVDMPFSITYGGEITAGTASDYKGTNITFTPAV